MTSPSKRSSPDGYHLWFAVLMTSACMTSRVLSTDLRVISYEDLHLDATTRLFERGGLKDFARILVDTSSQQVIVGIRDHLLRLRLTDLSPLEVVRWPSDNLTVSLCLAKGQVADACHNFVRVLARRDDELFACGTNAFTPQCSWRKLSSLGEVSSWVVGVAKCPHSPRQNATYTLTSQGDFYSAVYTDFNERDAAIYRAMGPSKPLRTVQHNSRWLNEPDFVSAHEVGEYIYVFFRETAVEYINCGKAVYSRVARICKNDSGGKVVLEDNWTTFVKARLNCSLPGAYPFYFDYLQAVEYAPQQQTFFAAFTTSPTSIYGSAVCVYNLTSFEDTFSGAFKHQETWHASWTKVTGSPAHSGCGAVPSFEQGDVQQQLRFDDAAVTQGQRRHLVNIQKYQLMDGSVQPVYRHPLITAEHERFTHLVVDQISVGHRGRWSLTNALFLATLEGAIHKYVVLPPEGHKSCLVEKIQVMSLDRPQPIRSMQLIQTQGMLIVGTTDRLYLIAVQRCSRFKTRKAWVELRGVNGKLVVQACVCASQCLHAQDPYCNWNEEQMKCVLSGHPHLTACPRHLQYPVDGGWSHWSEWQACAERSAQPPLDGVSSSIAARGKEDGATVHCLCRARTCDKPRVVGEGLPCTGVGIEVINCTMTTDITGVWSAWSTWGRCSSPCGPGQTTRRRTCLLDQQAVEPGQCEGTERETTVCDLKDCEDQTVSSDWTHWISSPNNDTSATKNNCGGHLEERHMCVCRASPHPSDFSLVLSASIQTQVRFTASAPNSSGNFNDCDDDNLPTTFQGHDAPIPTKNSYTGKAGEELDDSVGGEDSLGGRKQGGRPRTPQYRRAANESYKYNHYSPPRTRKYCECRDLGLLRICRRCSPPLPGVSVPPTLSSPPSVSLEWGARTSRLPDVRRGKFNNKPSGVVGDKLLEADVAGFVSERLTFNNKLEAATSAVTSESKKLNEQFDYISSKLQDGIYEGVKGTVVPVSVRKLNDRGESRLVGGNKRNKDTEKFMPQRPLVRRGDIVDDV